MDTDVADILRTLEERLLQPSVRSSADQLSSLLADDFIEFGSSGRIYDRAQVLQVLPKETPTDSASSVIAHDFSLRLLGDGVALLTYWTERRMPGACVTRSRRSSIWRLSDGRWELVFHQGTPIPHEVQP